MEGRAGRTACRTVVGTALALVLGSGCASSPSRILNPAGGSRSSPIVVPDALTFTWEDFDVRLEPTVVLWAQEVRVDIDDVVREALAKSQRDLRGTPVPITVQAGSIPVIPEVGIGGNADPVTGQVTITMDHRSPLALRQMLTVWLPLALAHELHHSKRILDGPEYGKTLLEAMITEGSAEAFVREVFPDAPGIPWVAPFDQDEEREVWQRAQAELQARDDLTRHHAWFYGAGNLPRWAGYRIGYAIVTAYLERHPEVGAADLAMIPAEEVYRGSAYAP